MYFNCFHVPLSYAVYTQWPECQVVFFNFDLLHSVRGSWPDSRETSFDRFCLLCWSCWLVAAPSKKVVKTTLSIAVKNHFWLVATRKRELENNQTIFEICVLNPFPGQKKGKNFFWTGSREDRSLRERFLSLQSWKKKSSIFSTLVEPYRPTVSPMIRTLSKNRLKHHLPKWKVISLFFLQRFLTKHHICLITFKRSALRDILRKGYLQL